MNVRPAGPAPIQPAQPQRSDAARLAAQQAFFALATGKTAAPTAVTQVAPAAAPKAAPAPAARMTATPAEQPARPLRPGSLLDIRV